MTDTQPRSSRLKRRKNAPTVRDITPQKPLPAPLPILPLIGVWGILIVGVLGLGWRLYQLQIVQAESLQKKARQQQTVSIKPYIPRRSIIDSRDNVLAADRLVYTLYVHPKLFSKPDREIADKLASILNKPSQTLLEQFKKQETGIRLANDIPEANASTIRQLFYDGIEVIEHYTRYYPQKEALADVMGYVDGEHQGQAGIELSQRQLLERQLYTVNTRQTREGQILPAFLPKRMFKFDDLQLQLTLDLPLQRAARSALKQQLKKYNAKRGAVIVMDAKDGSLLTLVCEPTFNPNEYYKHNVALFKNWTVADLYEPGSTFKPINIAIALEAGVIQPNTIVHDSGSIIVDRWTIKNASRTGNGSMNIAQVLQTSSNVGMVQIMQRLKRQDFYHRLLDLELGEKSGVDLPGEATGHLKSEKEFVSSGIETATTAFGQGFSLTPLKLVQLQGALANGGTLVTPHIVRGLVDGQKRLHWQPSYPTKTLFSPQTAQKVVDMMETVVTEGTGKVAQIPRYRIAGKTGTAQKASPNGGYLSNAKITSFVAILPVDSPRYVILAVVDEPKGGNTFGSTVAAPIVKSVMEALISIKGIPPSSGTK